MTIQHLPVAGDVVADRYRLLARLSSDGASESFRARDERLHRDVLLEVGLQPGATEGVRDLAGADDTGMHSVLDGGAVAGRTFVVRELGGSAFDETAPIHLGDSTAVMDVPRWAEVPSLAATPAPALLPPRRRRSSGLGLWVVGAAAALVLVFALAAWAGTGDLDPSEATTTTVGQVEASSKGSSTPVRTAPTSPTTTTTVAVATTDTTLGFPFDDGGPLPPGHQKKDGPKKG